jgi:hypothetical protein
VIDNSQIAKLRKDFKKNDSPKNLINLGSFDSPKKDLEEKWLTGSIIKFKDLTGQSPEQISVE